VKFVILKLTLVVLQKFGFAMVLHQEVLVVSHGLAVLRTHPFEIHQRLGKLILEFLP
jgi:hypothetical protein